MLPTIERISSWYDTPEVDQYLERFGGNIYFSFGQGIVLDRPELPYPGDSVFLPPLAEALPLIKKSLAQDIDVLYPACEPHTIRAPAPGSDILW